MVFLLWITIFVRSIPAFIDGSLFKAPYVPDTPPPKKGDVEKNGGLGSHGTSASTVAL